MSSHARRLALVMLVAGCTAPPPEPLRIDDPPPEPPLELPERLPWASEDLGEYVVVPGGELDGHRIPTLLFKRTEVTVAEYRACYRRGGCSATGRYRDLCNWARSDREQHPVNCVSRSQADEYCTWAGGRLPTQWEWEWAARGREAARSYPWGHAKATCARAVMADAAWGCDHGTTMPVGSKPAGASVDGLLDMAGNVWEWTSTQEQTQCGTMGVIKGGSTFVANPRWLRVDYDFSTVLDNQGFGDGIRCVRDLG